MIRGRDQNDVTWQTVDFKKQRVHDPLDFARLLYVPSFFPQCIKFIEEKNATPQPRVLE
jgi:hypothetical protein